MAFNSKTAQVKRGGVLGGLALVGFLILALGLGLFLAPSGALAQATGTPTAGATTAAGTTVAATTAAGTTAAATTTGASSGSTINVFCLDFGKTFPEGQTIKAQGLADIKVRAGLAYALSKGYVTSQPYQVQLAVWQLQDGQAFHDLRSAGTTIAQEIVTNAATTAVPQNIPADLNNLTLTNIKESSPQSAYGTATIQGTVNTQGLPAGFLLPASASTFQGLVGVVVSGSPATTAAATTAAATTAPATTVAATTAPATTIAATKTVAPTPMATPTVGGQGGATAAPATGFGGSTENGGTALGLISILAGLSVLALAGLVGLQMAGRKNR